ncbi:MAG: hypothetical protein E2O68_00380 [Deltaproteobacteria bacterium]|nr:MAG: hypothetical protein E2O68_00380 [Deltaproteobacteria bacterium]
MLFLAELVFVMELIAIGFGLYLLFLGKKEKAKILRVGGYILVVGATLVMIETCFFAIKFWVKGVPPAGYPKMSRHHKGMGTSSGNSMKYWCKQMQDIVEDCDEQACEIFKPMLQMCDRFDD